MNRALSLVLIMISLSCSKEVAKKGLSKFYVTKISIPDGWENRFIYTNDTVISKGEIYKDGNLIRTVKYTWNLDHTLAANFYDKPFDNLASIRKVYFNKNMITNIDINDVVGSINPTFILYKYQFSFDSLRRLDHYKYSVDGTTIPIETGTVKWPINGIEVVRNITSSFGNNVVVTVATESGNGGSAWGKLPQESIVNLLSLNAIQLIEYFSPNRVTSISSSSQTNSRFNAYGYDAYTFDENSNLTSIRRTDKNSGKIEYFRFEWKKVSF
jgi:hypothetical protein